MLVREFTTDEARILIDFPFQSELLLHGSDAERPSRIRWGVCASLNREHGVVDRRRSRREVLMVVGVER